MAPPGISPGPSWAVLRADATSSPSTRASHSDVDFDLDMDMGDDESEHEPERAPISKRKASTDEFGSARRPQKLPRLDPNGTTNTRRVASSSSVSASPSTSKDTGHAGPQKISKKLRPNSPERLRASRAESSSSGASTGSDFPKTLTQRIQKAIARDKEKEQETTRTQARAAVRRDPPVTARKQTVLAKTIRKVTTANLLKDAQKPGDPMDKTRAWTRVKPKKQKRTTFEQEMGHSRPLAMARERLCDTIELTDSSDSTRRARPSQPGPRPSVSTNKGDPIIIISDSDDERSLALHPTQRRKGPGENRKGVPPPADAEVISISDSDEDLGTSGAASRLLAASAAPAAPASTSRINSPPPSQGALSLPVPKPATAPTPITPVSTSTQLSDRPPSRPQDTQQQGSEAPSSPSYGPPPDDFDDAFGGMDFDPLGGGDINPSSAPDEWDNLDVGSSLATLQTAMSLDPVVSGADPSTSMPEGTEDESGPDALFASYLHMDQLEEDMDQEAGDDAPPKGGDEAEERVMEDGVTNGGGASLPDRPPTVRQEDDPGLDSNGNENMPMQDLEDGEVDPNEAPPLRTRSPETPESGEIKSQEMRKGSQLTSRPELVPASVNARLSSPASASLRSSSSAKSGSQPLERASALVMPDISLYKGVRFRRPFPGARENSFFSRALNGAARSDTAIEGVAEGEENGSGDVSTPAEVPSTTGEVQVQDGDADMQNDTQPSELSKALDEKAVPNPPPLTRQPEEDTIVPNVQSTLSTVQPAAEPSTTPSNLGIPVSTQLTTPSQVTPSQLRPVTQPVVSSSSPFIAPPRFPRPGNTMLTLVQVLGGMCQDKRQGLQEGRELARQRSAVNLTERATPLKNASQSPKGPSAPSPSQPSTQMPSSSQSTRQFGRTPSLNNLRSLLARRKPEVSPVRPVPAATSTRASNENGNSDASLDPVAAPASAPETMEAPTWTDEDNHMLAGPDTMPSPAPELTYPDSHVPMDVALAAPAATQLPASVDAKDGASSSSDGIRPSKSVASTPTPTTVSTSESSGSSSTHAKRRAVPFEAFISPLHERRDHRQGKKIDRGRGKEVHAADPFVSPTAVVSKGALGEKPKGMAAWHARRESASATFEAYIVRDAFKQTSAAGTGTGTGNDIETDTDDAQLVKPLPSPWSLRQPTEGGELALVSSPVVPDARPLTEGETVVEPDGSVEDADAMEVDVNVEDVRVDSARADEGEGKSETREDGEVDEADTLLELASVHLSQQEGTAEEVPDASQLCSDEVDEVGEMGVMDEPASRLRLEEIEEPEQDVGNAMVVNLDIRGGNEGETISHAVPDDAPSIPSQREVTKPELPAEDAVASVLTDAIASTSQIASEKSVAQGDAIRIPSYATTPDLVLPEDDCIPPVELLSKQVDQDDSYDPSHTRRRSGADSVAECDALLIAPTGYESEFEDLTIGSLLRGERAASTSLEPPRVHSRSPMNSPREWSPESRTESRTASTDSLDVVRRHPVSNRVQEGSESKYLCGYRIITWASYVAEQRERLPEYKLSGNIPHSLQDYMNTLPASFRNSEVARRVFEAHIQEAMINEPGAPGIEVFDNNFGEEVTPQWEFHYTNEMWYGQGVPPPDVKHLKSCGCVGKCDPKSGKCACSQRQLEWVQRYIDADIIPSTWPGSPFVYDSKGVLQRLECPIFECNRFCDCDDDCPNRVVQNGRKWPVHIVRTEHKGWGVSAGHKKIPRGSYLGIYAGELLTEQEGEERGKYYDLYGRTYLFSIDFHHLRFDLENPEEWENLYVVDAYHAGNFTRFLNHSCDPNCRISACYIDDADINKPLLAVFTIRDVEPWEELCFSYFGDDIDEKREEIEQAREREELERGHAVYAQCRCEASNCIGRVFS